MPVLICYLRTENYLPIALYGSGWILHMQIFTIWQLPKLEMSCLKLEFGETENLLGMLMQYAILEDYRLD